MSKHLKYFLLPLLAVVYPQVFLYSQNAKIIEPGSLTAPLLLGLAFASALFGLFLLFQRRLVAASLSAAIFMAFFYTYGPLHKYLLQMNLFPVEHFALLPAVVTIACYLGFLASKIPGKTAESIQKILLLILLVMTGYNVAAAIPVEMEKAQMLMKAKQNIQAGPVNAAMGKYPDIYYIVFDEYAGFQSVKEYWQDDYVDGFQSFLEQKGFFVATHSHSSSITSLIEVASRLNFTQYTVDSFKGLEYFEVIADNKAMPLLQSYGYTTVAFNGLKLGYPAMLPFNNVDYYYESAPKGERSTTLFLDDYQKMLLDNTMLVSFASFYQATDIANAKFRNMLAFTMKRAASLPDVASPKFVYVRVLFPHAPFMFDELCAPLETKLRYDWNYYLGQHKCATIQARRLIAQILDNADPQNPPIIILQSDHGARNMTGDDNSIHLENYPEKQKTDIMNAVYFPGYDYSTLTDDMDPIDALPTALNFYLNAGITVDRSQVD